MALSLVARTAFNLAAVRILAALITEQAAFVTPVQLTPGHTILLKHDVVGLGTRAHVWDRRAARDDKTEGWWLECRAQDTGGTWYHAAYAPPGSEEYAHDWRELDDGST